MAPGCTLHVNNGEDDDDDAEDNDGVDAYAHDDDYTYPFNRKRFGWTEWI